MTDIVVEAKGVYRTFEQELAPIRALRGADITVSKGEFVAVMGPSGCGKSTMLNVIAGLDRPDEGEVFVAGQDLTKLDENGLALMRRKHIGIVFQFFNLLEGMTVLENVIMPALIVGMKRRAAEARARDLLDLLGIGLSTGEVAAALLGSDERVEYTVVGDAVNLTQRLQQFGQPGQTVLSEPTWVALTNRPTKFEQLDPEMVKGRDTPVVAYRITGTGE